MKKTREIEEYFCDYCGEKCEHTDFVVPEEKSIKAHGLTSETELRGICEIHKDICPKCQKRLLCC